MAGVPKIADGGRGAGLWFIAILGIAQAGALGVVAWATRSAFGAISADTMPPDAAFAALLAGGLAVAGLRMWQRVRAERLGQSFAAALRRNLYAHIAGMSRSDLATRRMGNLSLRFVGDLSAARDWAATGVAHSVSAVVVLAGAAVAFMLLRPQLALPGLLPMAGVAMIGAAMAAGLGPRHLRLRRQRARIASSLMERVALAPDLDLAGRTARELNRLDDTSARLSQDAVSRRTRSEAMRALPHLGTAIGGVAVLWTAASHGLPTAEAAAALAILSIIAMPLRDLAGVWDRWCAWRITRAACERLFAAPSRMRKVSPRGVAVPVRLNGGTALDHPVAVDVPAGAFAVISGPAGSGKSALARTIAGQDRPAHGVMDYGGGCDLPSIAHVAPQPLALKGSLRRTLTLGLSPRPPGRKVHKIARSFGLGPLLDRLGSTTATIGEGGRWLSTQEQLSAGLARAAMLKPDLIVIDHPAVGPATADLIRRLRKAGPATFIVVADPDLFPEADLRIDMTPRDA